MPIELPDLNEEQKALALKYCAEDDLGAIARRCFGEIDPATNLRIDGRSSYAKAVKAYLAGEGKTVRTTVKELVQPGLELSEDQKRQIEALAPKMREGGSAELARIVWNDPSLTPLHKETRLVRNHMKEVYPEGLDMSEDPVEEREWTPPISLQNLVGLVNTFVVQGDNRKTYNSTNLKPSERKCLESLMRYMRKYKIRYVASRLLKRVDRDLFLSTFICWAHDKPDLTEIEQDQTIMAAEEMVNIASIGRDIQRIERMHDDIMAGNVVNEEGRKVRLTQNDVEAINNIRTKHDASKKQLKDLMDRLEESRSERDKERRDRYVSISDILEAFQKNTDLTGNGPFRDTLLAGGKAEKEEDAKEVERLTALEEAIALISGQSKEEARS